MSTDTTSTPVATAAAQRPPARSWKLLKAVRKVVPASKYDASVDVASNTIAIGKSEFTALANLIKVARRNLRPLAEARTERERQLAIHDLGDTDGVGVHLRLAGLDLNHDGSLSEAEYTRFMSEAKQLLDNLAASSNNAALTNALLLTITVDLLLVEIAPPMDDFRHGPFAPLSSGWISGGDQESAESLMHAFYGVEVAFLSLSFALNAAGLICSIMMQQMVAAMPGKLASLKFILAHPKVYAWINALWFMGLACLILAVAFVASRYSVVAFFAVLSTFVCLPTLFFILILRKPYWWQQRFFQEQAAALWAPEEEEERTQVESIAGRATAFMQTADSTSIQPLR